jgi:hypothetical protein
VNPSAAEDRFDRVLQWTLALVAFGAVEFLLLLAGFRGADVWVILAGAVFARRPIPASAVRPGDTRLRLELRHFVLPAALAIGAGLVAARLADVAAAQLLLGLSAVVLVIRGYYRLVDR